MNGYFAHQLALIREALTTRTEYTLGPASGSYDIEWPNGENAAPEDAPDDAKITRVGGQVFLSGQVIFSGANADSFDFTVPAGLRPAGSVYLPLVIYDGDDGQIQGQLYVGADGVANVSRADGAAWALFDSFWLSGSYLVAE